MSTKPGDWWDKSWNPWEGCTPVSEACENCWALAMLKRFKKQPFTLFLPQHARWRAVASNIKPTRYFVCSLSDFFIEGLTGSKGGIHGEVFELMEANPRHTFVTLTKRPHNWSLVVSDEKYIRFPPNLWMGITAENQARFDERLVHLSQIPATIRFVSMEPLLGPIHIGPNALRVIDWVIVGGETGPNARPMHPDWVMSLRDQCITAGIPFWFKGWGSWLFEGSPVRPNDPRVRVLNLAGGHGFHGEGAIHVRRRRNTGRWLDDRKWNELPRVVR